MEKKATLKLPDGGSIDFPVLSGSVGPDVVDIRALYGKTGVFTYDPGFLSTASCASTITYIDGDKGVLLYRGYPIEQLAVHCDFLEVCYLLLKGELPNAKQKDEFVGTVTKHTMVHEQINRFFTGFRRDAHPMAVLAGVVGALSAFYHDSLDITDPHHREISAIPADRQAADAGGDGLQVQHGPAVHLPAQRPVVHRELHAHDVRGAVRGVQDQRRAGARARPHLHPARRPRAERLDLDRAAVRLLGRQSVRLHRRGHRLPVGPGARRRQRGGAEHARSTSATCPRSASSSSRSRTRTPASS